MRVAYNGLFLTRPFTGMGQYTRNFLQAIATQVPDEHVVLVPEPLTVDLPKNLTVQVVKPSRGWLGRGLALDRWETNDLAEALEGTAADLYHTMYPTPPATTSTPTVMTVHDMIPWQLPEYRRGVRRRVKLGRILRGIQEADQLCTVSEASKKAISRLTVVAPERITVTYNGLDARFFKPVPHQKVTKARKAHGLTKPYVLYLGGYDVRKDIPVLLEAFAQAGLTESHDLALAGALTAPKTKLYADYGQLAEQARRLGISESVRRLGFVDEADKHALLAGADLFAWPSRAEGFGLPALEALAVGTRVVAADIDVNTELFGDTVARFTPGNAEHLAELLKQGTRKPSEGKRRAGRARAKKYTWESAAARTAGAYEQLLS